VGGHETTANVIAVGTAALLDEPAQLAALRADPALLPSAVEEFLRYVSPGTATNRVATADIELGGHTVKAGEGVIVHLTTVARDARVFPDPQRLDIRRGARNHLAFSHGIHQCLGQNLARLELEIVFETLLRRLPNLCLTRPVTDLSYKFRALAFGVQDLEVAW
jgi:pentalenic acid synthase